MNDGLHSQDYYILSNNLSASDYIYKGKLKFSRGNAFKYISRVGRKPLNTSKNDLDKALVYILSSDREFSFIEKFILRLRNMIIFHDNISDDNEINSILKSIIVFDKKEVIAKKIIDYMISKSIEVSLDYELYTR